VERDLEQDLVEALASSTVDFPGVLQAVLRFAAFHASGETPRVAAEGEAQAIQKVVERARQRRLVLPHTSRAGCTRSGVAHQAATSWFAFTGECNRLQYTFRVGATSFAVWVTGALSRLPTKSEGSYSLASRVFGVRPLGTTISDELGLSLDVLAIATIGASLWVRLAADLQRGRQIGWRSPIWWMVLAVITLLRTLAWIDPVGIVVVAVLGLTFPITVALACAKKSGGLRIAAWLFAAGALAIVIANM
jgi:hypothetical protein